MCNNQILLKVRLSGSVYDNNSPEFSIDMVFDSSGRKIHRPFLFYSQVENIHLRIRLFFQENMGLIMC